MKILVTHGFYSDENSFGAEVCGEYLRKYDPSREIIASRGIENPAQRGDIESGRMARLEISDMLERDKPEIFIGIVSCRPLSQQDIGQTIVGKQLSQLGYKLSKGDLSSSERVEAQFSQRSLANVRSVLNSPLKYVFFNPNVDATLYLNLKGKPHLAQNMGNLPGVHKAMAAVVPPVKEASERGIPYIWLIPALSREEGKIIEDDQKFQVFERAVEFIQVARKYLDSGVRDLFWRPNYVK